MLMTPTNAGIGPDADDLEEGTDPHQHEEDAGVPLFSFALRR